jgi:hypothetical protein
MGAGSILVLGVLFSELLPPPPCISVRRLYMKENERDSAKLRTVQCGTNRTRGNGNALPLDWRTKSRDGNRAGRHI